MASISSSSSSSSSTSSSTSSSSSCIVGGRESVKRYMLENFQYTIPDSYATLTPDIILYTWASVCGRPLPAGRAGEKHNYASKIRRQSETMLDYVHVLFYSRWRMTNELEMLGQVRGENLLALCLEDLPELYPPHTYDRIPAEYNALYFMDYLRQMAMYEAARFREVVRGECAAGRASVLTGNALMYVDMDVTFYRPPKEWIAPEGVLSFVHVQDGDVRTLCKRGKGDVDSFLGRARLEDAVVHMTGENCMLLVGYEYAKRFRRYVPYPALQYDLLREGRCCTVENLIMCFYQQARCLLHENHQTHRGWVRDSVE